MGTEPLLQKDFLARYFPRGVGCLKCPVQRYAWGVPASRSIVARLAGIAPSEEPCAELWMGAHPHGSADLVAGAESMSLAAAVRDFSDSVLGGAAALTWGARLPFLFKVLAIEKPLSIQAHPDAALAAKLHARDPKNYPDASHKPEIGVALDEVELLAGFRPPAELAQAIAAYPELGAFFAGAAPTAREIYRRVLRAADGEYRAATSGLAQRLGQRAPAQLSPPERYFLAAYHEYGAADRGLLCFFILNFVVLPPGEAIFIGPHFPHAYLKGEVVECMANSDNVVRAGLTKKFQDTEVLESMLDYSASTPQILSAAQHQVAPGRVRYEPAREFYIERCAPSPGPHLFDAKRSAQVMLSIDGVGQVETGRGCEPVMAGSVMLIPEASGSWSLSLQSGTCFVAGAPIGVVR